MQQRHARTHHGGQLAGEQRDVLVGDLAAAGEGLLADLVGEDALAAQHGLHDGFGRGAHFAADDLAGLVLAFPDEQVFADGACVRAGVSCRCSGHRLFPREAITRWCRRGLRSGGDPCFTFSRPDWRRSRTPSLGLAAMSIELPFVMIIRAISSEIGITW
jgi:hypothetical protein